MRFSMSARYNRRAWLNCLPPSLCFHVCFARIVPYFDPDRYAMKNVETLIILKRSNEDLVELTSSDVPERSEAWKLSFTRFGEVSEFLNDQPSPLTVGCSAHGSGLVLEEIWSKMAHLHVLRAWISSWIMILKLSDTWLWRLFHSFGVISRKNLKVALANCF